MEADDPPLATSWAPRALRLFEDELHEFEELSRVEAKILEADLEQLKAQTTAEATRLLAQNSGPQKSSNASHHSGNATSATSASATRRAPKSAKEKGAEANNTSASARRENMIEARTNELVAQYERQPWRRLYQQYQSQLASVQAAVEPVRAREGREFDFFTARAAESYTLDDVLDATRHRHADPGKATPATGDLVSSALAATANSPSPTLSAARRPSSAPSDAAMSVMSNSACDDGQTTAHFIIDAVQFARKYNEALTATYGYKPVLGTDLPAPSASHSDWAEDPSMLRAKLDQHAPGLDTVPNAFCGKTFPPPGRPGAPAATVTGASATRATASSPLGPLPPAPGASSRRRPFRADGQRRAPYEAAAPRGAATAAANEGSPLTMDAFRLPILAAFAAGGGRHVGSDPSTTSTALSSSHQAQDAVDAAGYASTTTRKAKLAGRGTLSKTKAAAPAQELDKAQPLTTFRGRLAAAPKVECSAKDDRVVLATVTGQEVRQTIRFTNRAAHRMRFRVKPSTHAWLTYTCTRIAPVPGSAHATATATTSSSPSGDPSVSVETPLSSGGYIEVEVLFDPVNTSEPMLKSVLEVGIAREVNARSGEGAQWDFYSVAVQCETVLPAFTLYQRPPAPATAEASAQVTRCAFPFTFVLAESTLHYQLENTGSTACVRLLSDSEDFLVDPAPTTRTLLSQGDKMDVSITFAPRSEGRCRSRLILEVTEGGEGPVLSRHPFELRGEGVLPRVHLHRLDDAIVDTSGHPQWQINPEEGPARVTLSNTTPDVPKVFRVVVTNDSPVPLPFEWVCEANNDDDAPTSDSSRVQEATRTSYATELAIVPASGSLAANAETVFEATITAHSVFPLLTSWCLYLTGLPMVAKPALTALSQNTSPEALALYERPKLVPSARAKAASDRNGTDDRNGSMPHTSGGGLTRQIVDAYADPVGAFQPHVTQQPASHLDKVFVTGFFAVAYPTVPSAVLVPSCLEEAVDCLVHYENVRRVTLKNHSPRELHFILDPSLEECRGWCAPSPWRFSSRGTDEPDVQVTFTPRSGAVPPFGSATITVRFAVHTVGPHHLEISCFIPEITAYVAGGGAPADGDASPSARRLSARGSPAGLVEVGSDGAAPHQTDALASCSHTVSLHVTGVGPSVHTSTECLDFGLIEEGHEAEASFTVTNDNPIPITFDLLDPLMRDPPRFVFIPPMFRLSAGDSVEVTVYRKGVASGDAQTYFELCVRDGATIAIETRATIQSATLMLEEAVLQHGTVPENVWQERTLHVTNTSALDAPFTVEMAFPLPTPHIDVEFTAQHVVRAGQTHYPVPIRTRFRPRPVPSAEEREAGIDRYRTLLAVRSLRTNRALLVEVRCEDVEQLAVSFDVMPTGLGGNVLPATPEQYVRALLSNEVIEPALRAVLGEDDESDKGSRDQAQALRAYCAPVSFTTVLPDTAPISRETFMLCLTNHTGCESDYHVRAQRFAPLPVEAARYARGVSPNQNTNPTLMPAQHIRPSSNVAEVDPLCTNGEAVHQKASATVGTNAGAVPMLTSTKRAFWTTAVNGTEQREREKRTGFSVAQQLLRDGRGCATMIEEGVITADGVLCPHAEMHVPFALIANLPGRYEETLRVSCGSIAPVRIPITYEVRGCPLLVDPTTSGLTCVDGLDVLVMPPVIASVGTSRRAVRVMNRVPRDVNVSVESFITASTFEIVAVEDDVAAAQVVLKLAPLTARTNQREHERKGHTFVSPARFLLPAMASKEVVVEYTPSLTLVKDVLTELDGDDAPQRKTRGSSQHARLKTAAVAAPSSILTSSGQAQGRTREEVKDARRRASSAAGGGRADDRLGEHTMASASSSSESETSDDDDDRVRPAATQEVDWYGSLVIQAEIAESAFNDAFLIDEFYFLHADKYPSVRRLGHETLPARSCAVPSTAAPTSFDKTQTMSSRATIGGGESIDKEVCPSWAKSVVRSVPMLDVQKPLLSRPGRVLRQSRLLAPTQAEQLLLDRELQQLGLAGAVASPSSRHHGLSERADDNTMNASDGGNNDVSSSGDDESQGMGNVPLLDAAAGEIRPVAELLAEHEERLALEAFLRVRREEVRLESTHYFVPLELRLRARCGVPRLAVQPSANGVFFPPYAPDQPCLRTIRLTNRNSASLFFQLAVTVPEYFRVVSATLVPSGVEEDPLVEEDDESKLGTRAMKELKWSGTADQKRAAKMLKSGKRTSKGATQRSAIVTLTPQAQSNMAHGRHVTETLSPLMNALKMALMVNGATHSNSTSVKTQTADAETISEGISASNPVYCLRSSDALDVTVEVVNAMHFARKAETRYAVRLSTDGNHNHDSVGQTRTGPLGITTNNNDNTAAHTAPAMALPPLSLDAILSIRFLQTAAPRPPVFTPTTGTAGSEERSSSSRGHASATRPSSKPPVPALTTHHMRPPDFVEQTVPLCMYFTAVVVSSAPSLVWFKPGQLRHDGRRQPSYTQRMTLFNHTKQPVTYQLVPVSAQQSFSSSSREAAMGSLNALTAERKLHEVTNLPEALVGEDGKGTLLIDDASPFTVTPARGVIPAASRGGEPGVVVMHATFTEHSNVRYECAYRVLINGTLSECTFLLRGDSRESEV